MQAGVSRPQPECLPAWEAPPRWGVRTPVPWCTPQSPWQCGSSGPIRSVCFIYGPAERTLTEVSFQLTVFWPQGPQPGCWEADSDNQVAQSRLTLCHAMDYTVHGNPQGRILEWAAFPFSRGSSQPRDRAQVSHIAGGFFTS